MNERAPGDTDWKDIVGFDDDEIEKMPSNEEFENEKVDTSNFLTLTDSLSPFQAYWERVKDIGFTDEANKTNPFDDPMYDDTPNDYYVYKRLIDEPLVPLVSIETMEEKMHNQRLQDLFQVRRSRIRIEFAYVCSPSLGEFGQQ